MSLRILSCAMVAGLVHSAIGPSCAFAEPPDKSARAIDRGLTFLIKDAKKWRDEHKCASCHHGTMTVWALSEAKAQGYAVKEETLADIVKWTKGRLKDIDKPRDPRPGWKMVNSPALYLAVMAQAVPKQEALSADELKRIAGHLVRHQEADGSWAWSSAPPANRPPPFFESDELATLLALTDLSPHVPADAKAKSDVRDRYDKGAAWLARSKPAETTQWLAFQLFADARAGKPAKELQTAIDKLLARQNKDGGWGQIKDALSDAYATGQALYFLSQAGVKSDRAEIQRGVAFLVSTQREDGSWPMKRRGHPGVTPGNFVAPITYFGSAWGTMGLLRTTGRQANESRPAQSNRLFLVRWNDKCGFIDRNGNVVVQVKYDDVDAYDSSHEISPDEIARRSFSEGLRPVKLGQKWGYIDAQDKFVIAPTFDMAGPFRGGRAQVCNVEKWGMIDRAGKVVVELKYSYIARFEGGWAPVAVGGKRIEGGFAGSKWGLIDASGKEILPPKYGMVYLFGKDVALANVGGDWKGGYGEVLFGGKWGLVDRRGKFEIEASIELPTRSELSSPAGSNLDEGERPISLLYAHGFTPVSIGGKWGYMDERGHIAIKPQFDWAGPFAVPPPPGTHWSPELGKYGCAARMKADSPTALARARLGGKLGFIDRTGSWVVKARYDQVGHFSGGLAWAKEGDRFVFVDEKGSAAFPVEMGEEGGLFWNGLGPVRVGERWGYVDRTGRWVHEPQFDEIDSLTESLQIVVKDKKRGLINQTGKLVCPIQYDWISELGNSGLAVVQIGHDHYEMQRGVIDKSGRVLLEPIAGRDFSTVTEKGESDQKAFPRRKGPLWGFTNREGKFVIEPRFDSIDFCGDGMVAVRASLQSGLVDVRSGQLVCPPKYYAIGKFSEGLAEVQPESTGKFGYVDRTGKLVIPATWNCASQFRDGVAGVSPLRPQLLWIDRTGKYLWDPTKK